MPGFKPNSSYFVWLFIGIKDNYLIDSVWFSVKNVVQIQMYNNDCLYFVYVFIYTRCGFF